MSKQYEVSLFVTVSDPAAVLNAAARDMVRTKSRNTFTEAKEFIGGRVEEALRLLLDPGSAEIPGLEIDDSACIEEGTR